MPQRLAAVGMIRDEEDIIEYTLWNLALQGVDAILVAENMSTDNTPATLARLVGRLPNRAELHVFEDREEGYYQSRKITELARRAHDDFGATHVLPFDADEFWYSEDGRPAGDVIKASDGILAAKVYEHRRTLLDPVDANPFARIAYRLREPLELRKLAFAYRPAYVVGQGNHAILNGSGHAVSAAASTLGVRHYPQRSPQQLLRKVRNGGAAYRATDLPDSVGAHWRLWYHHLEVNGEAAIYEIFRQHYYYPAPWAEPDLVCDPAPVGWRSS